MEKIERAPDALEITSFETAPLVQGEEGTVFAHGSNEAPAEGTCQQETCVQDCYWTIWQSCGCTAWADVNCIC